MFNVINGQVYTRVQFTVVDIPTLGLLKRLKDEPAFTDLRLVGGTTLALKIEHRR